MECCVRPRGGWYASLRLSLVIELGGKRARRLRDEIKKIEQEHGLEKESKIKIPGR